MPEPPERPPGLWIRLTLGALLVILASASATAVAAFREVDRLAGAFGGRLDLGGGLAEADAGTPQTVLIIGSDKRARTAQDARLGLEVNSDTMILVRLDPSEKATALMSLPRDLKVRIPGHGTDKLNAAYALGGPRLTLETVKQLTGLRINHVINVDFGGFRKAVDAIGCVYVDIDRRYFNAQTGPGGFAAIDIQPGYQRLCGEKALQYVRHRHSDNDLVRSARQQDFLRQAKQQIGVGRLFADRRKLIKIFGRYTESDIESRAEVLRLLKLVIASASHPIREVHFEGRIGRRYVTVSYERIETLISQFLGVEETRGPRGIVEPGRRRRARRGPPLQDAMAAGRQQALAARAAGARFPVLFPGRLTPGAGFVGQPRTYLIADPGGRRHRAYRMVIRRGPVGEFYGVQGTTWKDPPILREPSETRRLGGRTYELHFDGDRLRLVAWRSRNAAYWVSNTLLQTLSERQMLALARSLRAL